jgi:nitroimidazol reductase NimA-like FMN-containing flavoprotein (pyridoxamine 5'-phosphate oxidase superfamily)
VPETRTRDVVQEPTVTRPIIPGYGVPETDEGTLPWSHVEARMAEAKNYWVASVGSDGQPHAVPVWGIWLNGALYFGIGPRSSRNIAANPRVSIHLENGNQAVILEGRIEILTNVAPELTKQLDDATAEKYDWRPSDDGEAPGEGTLMFHPRTVFAWTSFPSDATKWTFA